jgi:hypothetical protein
MIANCFRGQFSKDPTPGATRSSPALRQVLIGIKTIEDFSAPGLRLQQFVLGCFGRQLERQFTPPHQSRQEKTDRFLCFQSHLPADNLRLTQESFINARTKQRFQASIAAILSISASGKSLFSLFPFSCHSRISSSRAWPSCPFKPAQPTVERFHPRPA